MNRLIQGDCLAVMKSMPTNSVDLTVTSPPYDNLRDYNGYTFDFEGIAKELFRITKEGGIVVWIVGDATIKGSETGTSFKQALYFKEIGFRLHDTMIYAKQNPVPYHHNRYNPQFEFMFILSKGKPKTFNAIQEPTKGFKTGKYRYPDGSLKEANTPIIKATKMLNNIWFYVVGEKSNFNHPASFPEKLAEDHILSWSNECDTVLDPMCGSGTTLKMAKKNNRNFIGIEISKEYCDIIKQRIGDIEVEQFGTVSETVKSKKPIEASKEVDNKWNSCPSCGGKLKKTKYGKTCEDCLEDY